MTDQVTEPMRGVVAVLSGVPRRLYPANGVPDSPEYPYGSFSASFGRPDAYTLDSRHGGCLGRVVVKVHGRTVDSVNGVMNDVVDALVDQRLQLDGFDPSTPCRMELDPTHPSDRDADDAGVLTSTATFTFTASKES